MSIDAVQQQHLTGAFVTKTLKVIAAVLCLMLASPTTLNITCVEAVAPFPPQSKNVRCLAKHVATFEGMQSQHLGCLCTLCLTPQNVVDDQRCEVLQGQPGLS